MTMKATTIHRRRMHVVRGLMPLMALVVAVGVTQPAYAVDTVTSFAPSTNTTPGVWYENDVRFGGTASIADLTGFGGNLEGNQPLPIGAAKLTTTLGNLPDKAEVGVLNDYGMPDDILSTLSISYSYHKASNLGQNLAAAPSLKLTFFNPVCDDPASLGDCFGTLVYEPTWNGPGSTPATPASTSPATDTWTTVTIDENTGLFWSTGLFGAGNTAGGPPINTLAGWSAVLSSDFGDAILFQVSIGVGSFNNGQIGYFDDVSISHSFGGGFSESYDFEPPPPVVKNLDTTEEFLSIQAAIDDADTLDGHTLEMLVPDHTTVTTQVHFTKSLTLQGASPDVLRPSADTATGGDARGWFLVDSGLDVTFKDLIFDGSGFKIWQAIRSHGTLTVTDCEFTDINFDSSGPSYAGTAIVTSSASGLMTVSDCTFTDIGRIGIHIFGPATVERCTYTGKGVGDFLDYMVCVGGFAGSVGTATITDCTVTDNRGVADSDGSTSAGMLVTDFFGPGVGVTATITGCKLNDNTVGLVAGFDSADTSSVTANNNDLSGNDDFALINTSATTTVDASANWWGSSTPAGVTAEISGTVDYTPWFDAGTDTSGDPGFQGDFSVLHVDDDSPQIGASGRIEEGIELVTASTIFVEAGTYFESNVIIDKAVTIVGAGVGSTFVDPAGAIGFRPFADGITITDMTIQNGSQAIRFEMAGGTIDGTTLRRVTMVDCSSRGIEVHNATTVTNLLVDDCTFDKTVTGLRVSSSGHLNDSEFRDSTFTRLNIGLYEANGGGSSTMQGLLVTGCTFEDISVTWGSQSTAIFLEEIQDALIEDNTFINNRRDIQIFKWYQASVPVSNVLIQNNTMTGTKDSVFAIFNAHHLTGQTTFDGVTFTGNTATIDPSLTDNGGAVFAGAHSTDQNQTPSLGGLGWETVHVNCNTFLQAHIGEGVRFFIPGVPDDQALGGASIDVRNNWWGTADALAVEALMQLPAITDFVPFLASEPGEDCQRPECSDDNDCPEKCEDCDEALGECVPILGCCTSEAECPGCQDCDLATNTCFDDQDKCPGCRDCVNAVCVDDQSKCTGCEDCVDAVCVDDQDKCPGCQDCVDAACVDDQDKCPGCQDCVDAQCVDDQAKCSGCEDCVDAQCVDDDDKCHDGDACTSDICADGECTFPSIEQTLIIKQGASGQGDDCHAPVNSNSNGVIPILLVGTNGFDVHDVDQGTLDLHLCNGGPGVQPIASHTKFKDLNHPTDLPVGCPGCQCNDDESSDGIDDLSMKFSTDDVVSTLGLTMGAYTLELTGTANGAPFCARDCIVVIPPGSGLNNATMQSNVVDTMIEVTPMDLNFDIDGFADFNRSYIEGTTITLTAPSTSKGRRFLRWSVNGEMQVFGIRTIEVTISKDTTLKAFYQRASRVIPELPTEGSGDME